jgi:cytochrome c oxidase assembly factor CtaG
MLFRLAFATLGLSTLAAALITPLHWLGEHLFTFHMIEHEIVIAVSAPLIVLARPVSAYIWVLPRKVRHLAGDMMNSRVTRRLWSWLTRGANATALARAVAV